MSVRVTINQAGLNTLNQECQRWLGTVADDIASTAKELAPVRTGRLRDSIKADKTNLAQIKVVASAPYAGYVEAKDDFMLEETKNVFDKV